MSKIEICLRITASMIDTSVILSCDARPDHAIVRSETVVHLQTHGRARSSREGRVTA